VWTAPYNARETFPEDHPQFAGFLPAWRDQIQNLLDPFDAILVVGAPVFTTMSKARARTGPSTRN
jgi:benzoylformate decarboxylase